jgi:hypothetical protein
MRIYGHLFVFQGQVNLAHIKCGERKYVCAIYNFSVWKMLTTSSDLNTLADCKMPLASRPDACCGGYNPAEEYFIPDILATSL